MNFAKFNKIRDRWRDYWRMDEDVCPMWVTPITSEMAFPAVGFAIGSPSFDRYLKNIPLQVISQIAGNEIRNVFNIGDDWIPFLMPQLGTGVFASAFGAKVEYFPHCLPWAHPIIKKDDSIKKVMSMKLPRVNSGQMKDVFKFTQLANFLTGGKYPIVATDLQGPADTAYLLWHPESFMIAMYDSPKYVHYIMNISTEFFIKYIKKHAKMCKEFIPFHCPHMWIPYGEGICISDDILAVLSANLWEEFALPYVNRVSDEFGGIIIHSCGNFSHQIENLKKVRNLKGINFGVTETPFETVWEAFGGKTCVIPHIGLNSNNQFKDEVEFVKFVLKKASTYRGLCIVAGMSMLDADAKIPLLKRGIKIIKTINSIRKLIKQARNQN